MTKEPKNYGHVLEAIGDAKREDDTLALLIIERSGATCFNLCPREGQSGKEAIEAITRYFMNYYLEEAYSRQNFDDKGKAVSGLQDIYTDVINRFLRGDEDE